MIDTRENILDMLNQSHDTTGKFKDARTQMLGDVALKDFITVTIDNSTKRQVLININNIVSISDKKTYCKMSFSDGTWNYIYHTMAQIEAKIRIANGQIQNPAAVYLTSIFERHDAMP